MTVVIYNVHATNLSHVHVTSSWEEMSLVSLFVFGGSNTYFLFYFVVLCCLVLLFQFGCSFVVVVWWNFPLFWPWKFGSFQNVLPLYWLFLIWTVRCPTICEFLQLINCAEPALPAGSLLLDPSPFLHEGLSINNALKINLRLKRVCLDGRTDCSYLWMTLMWVLFVNLSINLIVRIQDWSAGKAVPASSGINTGTRPMASNSYQFSNDLFHIFRDW